MVILLSKFVWLIRHGESTANAGASTLDHRTIPLTEKGRKQAQQVSQFFEQPPELIVVSPFTRAKETAAPTIRRFPNVNTEIWSVQEFTYLAPKTCVNTTAEQRRERVNRYWDRLDPDYIDGEDAESFNQLLARAQGVLQEIDRRVLNKIVIFSHAQFIRALCFLKEHPDKYNALEIMKQFRSLPRIDNCEIIRWKC